MGSVQRAAGLLLVAVGLGGLPAVGAASGTATAPLRVLILGGLHNHDWQSTTPVIRAMFEGCPRFGRVAVTEDPARLDAATLAGYDVVVSNWTPYPDTRRTWPPETETAFLEFVRNGGGFVVFHASACTFQVWPEFQELIALTWKENYTAHGAYHTFRVAVTDAHHPIARGLSDFYTTDELYHNMVHLAETPYQVVLNAFSAKDKGGTGKDEPMLACTTLGRGRGANLVLGHDVGAMGAGFRTLLLRSAEWAATGAVTIPPPAIWPSTPAAMAAAVVDVEAALAAVARYRYGDSRQPLHDVEELVRYASGLPDRDASGLRRRLAERLGGLLMSADTTAPAKAFLCGPFAGLATAAQAPLLGPLLSAPEAEVAQAALGALARIPGPAADRLLRDAAGTLTGDLRLGAVQALGERHDRASAAILVALLSDRGEPLACAAAAALGEIGSAAAAEALQGVLPRATGPFREAVAEACLACADGMLAHGDRREAARLYAELGEDGPPAPLRMAALRGQALADPARGGAIVAAALTRGDAALESMALQLVPQIPGSAATAQFAGCLSTAPAALQPALLRALAVRGDRAAREAVTAALASPVQEVRRAALEALGPLGDETTVGPLLGHLLAAPGNDEAAAAREALTRLRGSRVDRALAARLALDGEAGRTETVRILAARRAVRAVPVMAGLAGDPAEAVRKESWKALGGLAGAGDARLLLDLLSRAGEAERDEAEKAVTAVLRSHGGAEALLRRLEEESPPAVCAALIRVAGSLGDDRALPAVGQAVRSGDAGVRDAAVRALAAWPSPTPFEELVALAGHAQEPVHRVLALRGAVRMSGQVGGRSPEQMARLVGELMGLAGEAAERKAVLAELGRCPAPEAFALAQRYLADPDLATEAGVAVTQIAAGLQSTHRDLVLAALGPLLKASYDPAVSARAGRVLKDILKPVNLALGATATSPDRVDPDGASGGDAAAIDGNPQTYWDETDGCELYRLRVTCREPQELVAVNLLWHPYEQHQAKDLDVLCDGTLAAQVRDRRCLDNEMFLLLPAPTRCTSVELVIPGRNGLVSPAIHELQLFGRDIFPPEAP